jgi:hypothetical protein
MSQLNLTTFTPSTKIKSTEVSANFSAIQSLLNAVRPAIFVPLAGSLAISTNFSSELTIPYDLTFNSVTLRIKTAPTGAAVIVDIKKNGTTIFSTRPQIADGATTGGTGAVFSSASAAAGDVLTFDVAQVGSTIPGQDLTIALTFKY